MQVASGDGGPLAVLRRVRTPAPKVRLGEQCELCAVELPDEHGHVVNLDERSLICACQACGLLFANEGAGAGRYRAVPRDVYALGELAITRREWEGLGVPVGVAFLFHNSDTDSTSVFYPSPAGATESLLPTGAFEELAAAHPVVNGLAPDVQALLVRFDGDHDECFVVPIDRCYELVGLLRRTWRGFDGGSEAHLCIDDFFLRLRSSARPMKHVGSDGV